MNQSRSPDSPGNGRLAFLPRPLAEGKPVGGGGGGAAGFPLVDRAKKKAGMFEACMLIIVLFCLEKRSGLRV